MKKLLSFALCLLLVASAASAQMLIGGRASGMGGAGVAATDDISAAYYNPACLMRSEVMVTQLDVALGAGYSDLAELTNTLSSTGSPGKMLMDNYTKNLSFSGDLSGIVGLNIRKIGLSVIPMMNVNVTKPALSIGGSVTANGFYAGVLTAGYTFSVPFLPAALDVGVNAKSISGIAANATVNASITDPTKGTGSQTTASGAGSGFDLGLLTTFDVPFVSKLAVGAVMRDISSSYTLTPKTSTLTMDQTTGTVTQGPEITGADVKVTIDSSTAFGAYATVPVIGLGVAADIEMTKTDTNTHIGLEYPLLLNTIILRAGLASGPNLGLTTYGAEFDLRVLKLAVVAASDSKNTGLTRTYADIAIGL